MKVEKVFLLQKTIYVFVSTARRFLLFLDPVQCRRVETQQQSKYLFLQIKIKHKPDSKTAHCNAEI